MEEELIECPSCHGLGSFTIGDCEDGVDEICPECNGEGLIESGDTFVPERDAWRIRD